MKLHTLIITCLSAAALPAVAGSTSGKEVIAPVEQPSPWHWFAGASAGYLTELEEPMYSVHFGADTPWSIAGWDLALYLEIGFAERDFDTTGRNEVNGFNPPSSFDLDELEDFLSTEVVQFEDWGYDFDIMPVMFNAKLEKGIGQSLHVYAGVGAGFSLADLSISTLPSQPGAPDDSDWVATAQVFAGLGYDLSESLEIYGGARWIYFDDADIDGFTLDLGDDVLIEGGIRYNF